MAGPLDTIRARILIGLTLLLAGVAATAHAGAVRLQAAELTRLVRDLARRQGLKAAKAAEHLSAEATDREHQLWIFVAALVLAGFFLSRYTLESVHAPLGRLVTAAERLG